MSQYYILNANSKIIKIGENINPIHILDHEFLFYVNDDVNNSSSSLIESLKGGWIMRFNHSEGFDQKWKDCCKLYDQGKLTGIQAMGCSTDQKNPQSSDQTDDIILFLCGSTSDREQIMEYGRNLLKYIPYFSDNGLMTYGTYQNKFSKPTDCLYHILVPIPESADVNQFFLVSEDKRIIKINENKIPTEITDYEFLSFKNICIYNSFTDLDQKLWGNWKMFFKHTKGFDQKWKDCCKLYEEGKLTGIRELQCSTGFKNPKELNHTTGEIMFVCGPAEDKLKMLEFGENLLKYIPYCKDSGFMCFWSNEPIEKDSKEKFIYQIPVPKDELSDVNANLILLMSADKKSLKINENKIPTEILDYEILSYKNMNIFNKFPEQEKLCGSWIMRFKHAEGFDQKWKDCCKLYDESKLTGIRELLCTTGFKDSEDSDHSTGKIYFQCGPEEDKLKILEFGKNLLKLIPYCYESGFMRFCSNEPIEKVSKEKFIYHIPVPKNELSDVNVNLILLMSATKKPLEINENKIPTEILDYQILSYTNMNIFNKFPEQEKLCGSWTMRFKHAEGFDQKWKDCCKLYDESKLTGIRELLCTTGFKDSEESDHSTGEIYFACGPAEDKLKILEFGKNLLKLIPYCDESGFMRFCSYESSDEYFTYRIPVPKDESSDVKVNLWYLMSDYINHTYEEVIEINENKAPTQIFDYAALQYENINISNSLPNCELIGLWMMYFEHSESFDQKWKDCCKLYDEGKLTGIKSLRCSTAYKSVRTNDHHKSVIFFFCGPSNDKTKMLEYGRNLLKYIPYYSKLGHISYKTNEQAYRGTRATGIRVNSVYRIPVPMKESSDIETNEIALLSENKKYKNLKINQNRIPTEILDYEFVNYINRPIYDEIYNTVSYELRKVFSSWRMYFKHAEGFNQKWKECCKLYDEGKLTGIHQLKCSTGCRNSVLTDPTTGVIFFYSGPRDDRSKMLECGRNLLKYIPYYNDSGFMEYGHTKYLNAIWYRIPVPKYVNSDFKVNRIFLMPVGRKNIEISENRKPTEILDHEFLGYVNMYMYYSFLNPKPYLWGKWVMNFKYAQDFDQKWKDCCNLYDDGKLIGIRRLKCSTGFDRSIKKDSGVILFYCGPMRERSNVLEYGENLLKYITYYSESGFMEYRSADDMEDCQLYQITVPKNESSAEELNK